MVRRVKNSSSISELHHALQLFGDLIIISSLGGRLELPSHDLPELDALFRVFFIEFTGKLFVVGARPKRAPDASLEKNAKMGAPPHPTAPLGFLRPLDNPA